MKKQIKYPKKTIYPKKEVIKKFFKTKNCFEYFYYREKKPNYKIKIKKWKRKWNINNKWKT